MNVCVFCGSSRGTNPVYAESAELLADLLSKNNYTLIYGGGNVGIMGILADRMLANKSKVIGIIPQFLMNREVGHTGISTLEIVPGMHERKRRMAELSNAFIAFPGGMGTLEELAEILTWKQLGLINSSVGILNINHFFDHLMAQLELMAEEGFLRSENLRDLKISENPAQLLTLLGVVPT
jgi:uncharacterized protein (TIGR00730 family)